MKTRVLIAAALCLLSSALHAQTYPNRPIRVIVPQPPGGGFDLVARVIAEPLARVMGNPVVVENRPGAGMLLGTEAAARPKPTATPSCSGRSPTSRSTPDLYDKLPYDPRADFAGGHRGLQSVYAGRAQRPAVQLAEGNLWISRAPIRASSPTRARATAPGSTSLRLRVTFTSPACS
jgi:hypothetical protein